MKTETESRGFWLPNLFHLRVFVGRNWIWSLLLSFIIFLSVVYLVLALFAPGAVHAATWSGLGAEERCFVWNASGLG